MELSHVQYLTGSLLDAWVHRATHGALIGMALAENCPESGYVTVSSEQKNSKNRFLHYYHVPNCCCDIGLEMNNEINQILIAEGYEPQEQIKILGHDWQCLYPIASYSTCLNSGIALALEHKFSMMYIEEKKQWKSFNPQYEMFGDTLLISAMRLIVYKFLVKNPSAKLYS